MSLVQLVSAFPCAMYSTLDCALFPQDPYNHEDKVMVTIHDISFKDIVYKFYQCYRGGSVTSQLLGQQSSNKLLTKALLSHKASYRQ